MGNYSEADGSKASHDLVGANDDDFEGAFLTLIMLRLS